MNASKRTKFVSKLTVDMKSRQSEMQVGCVYMFKSGKMNMSLTSSGHLQSYIVRVSRKELCIGGICYTYFVIYDFS